MEAENTQSYDSKPFTARHGREEDNWNRENARTLRP
jgi:hypothetical protein